MKYVRSHLSSSGPADTAAKETGVLAGLSMLARLCKLMHQHVPLPFNLYAATIICMVGVDHEVSLATGFSLCECEVANICVDHY